MGPSSFHHFVWWLLFECHFQMFCISQYEILTVAFRFIHHSVDCQQQWYSRFECYQEIQSKPPILFQSSWLLHNYYLNAFTYFRPVMTVYHWWCYLWAFGYHFANPIFKIEQSLLWFGEMVTIELANAIISILWGTCGMCYDVLSAMWCHSIIQRTSDFYSRIIIYYWHIFGDCTVDWIECIVSIAIRKDISILLIYIFLPPSFRFSEFNSPKSVYWQKFHDEIKSYRNCM